MNLSEIAVKRPIAVSVGVIVVLILGFLSINNLGLDLFPDLQFPYITIATVYPAADPQTVEEEVTRPVEDMVATISGLRRVQSTSMENMSIVTAEFGWNTSINEALESIRANMSALTLTLPDDVLSPLVTPIDPGQLPVMIIGLSSSEGAEHTTTRAAQAIRPVFEQVPGVGQVTMLGGVQREIQVLYRSDKLEEHDLTPAMLEQLLSLQNALVPAGVIEDNGTRMNVRVGNHFSDVQEIRDLVLGESQLPVQGLAALWPPLLQVKDVAEVVEGFKETAGSARIDGQDTVLLHVQKRPGANTVQVAQDLHRAIENLKQTVSDINISIITDQSLQIISSLNNLVLFGSFGALLAVGVLFFFLRAWRGVVIIATAIPLSVVVTLAFLQFTDVSLNLMTLGGLSLGIGMLVDNAIIVLESIFRHRSQGAEPEAAAIGGAKEVAGAVFAATVTTVVVFLPVLFMETFAARLFRELGLTVSLSLFASLLVSLTVVPAMAGRLLQREAERAVLAPDASPSLALQEVAAAADEDEPAVGGRLGALYEGALNRLLDRKALVLGTVVVLIGATALLWPRLGLQFLPDMPSRSVYITMETAPGTPLAQSEAVAEEAERRLRELDLFQFITMQVGEQHQDDLISILSDHTPTTIKMIGVTDRSMHGSGVRHALQRVRSALADLPVESTSVSESWDSDANLFSSDVVLRVFGDRYDELESLAKNLEAELASHDAIAEIHASLSDQQPELFLAVDQSRALIGGLTTGQISLSVRNALTGVQATQVRRNGQTIPVVLRPHPDELNSVDDLLNFRVSSPVPTGMDEGSVRLANVVEARETTAPQTIRRIDGARFVEVRIKPAGADLREINAAVAAALDSVDVPDGVVVQQAGVMEHIDESVAELAFALLFALALVYLVMVAQFESWRNPLIILTTTPLAAIGVLSALWLTKTSVSVMPLLGFVILGGIVVNNGILLVDYISRLHRQGMDVRQAILVGARTRLRPVLMTATTTIGGMLPLAVIRQEGTEMQGPLAITVIGGLLTATLLTLFVTPTLYALLHRPGTRPAEPPSGSTSSAASSAPLLWIAGSLITTAALFGATPAAAQTTWVDNATSGHPTLAAGLGYDAGDGAVTYMAGAGWRASLADVDWIVFTGAAGAREQPTTWVIGARGNWFQPISFAGYYELEGVLDIRQRAQGSPTAALSFTGDAVLGNMTLLVEYDRIGTDFPHLPWDGPGRLPVLDDTPGFQRLQAVLTQQPQRDINLVRAFEWTRRMDARDTPGTLIVQTGAEMRSGRGWLIGQAGLKADADHWQPLAEIGVRLRPNSASSVELLFATTTPWRDAPALSARYEGFGDDRFYQVRLELQLGDDGRLQPSVMTQGAPLRQGWRWQLAFDAQDEGRTTSFGLFTTF